jgi:glycosyltransferase involved in cell wall biosynthesis
MMISVIIATRDRVALLADTLGAIAGQEGAGGFEVLVADNGSTDSTRAIVDEAARRRPVFYLREDRPGKSYALNTAMANARGDLIVLTDDDVLPSPGWLAAFRRAFDETGADFAAGRILPLWEAPPPPWISPSLHGVLAIPDGGESRLSIGKGLNAHIMPLGANMAVRRTVVERVGGWNTSLGKLHGTLRTGEDHEFALRLIAAGAAGVYEPAAVVQHRVPADRLRRDYFQRWFHENGAIVAAIERDHPTTDRYLLNVPRHLWRRALSDAAAAALAVVKRDEKRAAAAEMRLRWFAGYAGARWSS